MSTEPIDSISPIIERRMFDAHQVAEVLGISVDSVWRGVRRGDFPITPRRIGGVLRFPARVVIDFADGNPSSPGEPSATERAS